jgi:hypothetical protein
VKLHDVDSQWKADLNFSRDSSDIAAPIYYASLLGLDGVLHGLSDIYQDNRERIWLRWTFWQRTACSIRGWSREGGEDIDGCGSQCQMLQKARN